MGFEAPLAPSSDQSSNQDKSVEPEYSGDIMERCRILRQLANSNEATEDELIELRMSQSVIDAEKKGRTRTLKLGLIGKLSSLKAQNEQKRGN